MNTGDPNLLDHTDFSEVLRPMDVQLLYYKNALTNKIHERPYLSSRQHLSLRIPLADTSCRSRMKQTAGSLNSTRKHDTAYAFLIATPKSAPPPALWNKSSIRHAYITQVRSYRSVTVARILEPLQWTWPHYSEHGLIRWW